MSDLYSTSGATFGGSFSANAAKFVFSNGGDVEGLTGGVGLLTQSVNVQYAQQVTRLYEVGSNKVFLVSGRTQGQMGIGRILGPRQIQAAFYRNYGNVCNAAANNLELQFSAGCEINGAYSGGGGLNTPTSFSNPYVVSVEAVVLTSVAIQVAAQDMVVSEQLGATFVAMDIKA